eukprot:TRINITY_DN1218_c0_g1_i1.p1 TRINITY_DN1218_c0_g1~~TRINITY_DN1218_c0_g1_i1.p1  ORF type:complete len:205 (+),score=19.98 TRINITY_DN1218_c0_g1_i1:246-860(+)
MQWFPAIDTLAQSLKATIFLDTASYDRKHPEHWTDRNRIIPLESFPQICTKGTLIFLAVDTNAHRLDVVTDQLIQTYQQAVNLHHTYGCVVVFQDTPGWEATTDFPTNPLTCIQGETPLNECKKEKAKMMRYFETQYLPDLPNTHVVDMSDTICPYADCYAYNHTIPTYRDSHHLTVPIVNLVASTFFRRIDAFPCVARWKAGN